MNDFKEGGMHKWLTVGQLRRVTANMPDSYQLYPNAVKNLAVMRPNGSYAGFIDFVGEGRFDEGGADPTPAGREP